MGSLTSRPNLPQVQQQPVIITAPAPTSTYTPITTAAPAASTTSVTQSSVVESSVPAETETVSETSSEEAQRLVREDSLLRRSRGRLGTVLTGFSGLLSQTVAPSVRKSLLGE